MLSNHDYVYAACAVCVTIFSTGGKFRPVSNFTELHALTLVVHSYMYALLYNYLEAITDGHALTIFLLLVLDLECLHEGRAKLRGATGPLHFHLLVFLFVCGQVLADTQAWRRKKSLSFPPMPIILQLATLVVTCAKVEAIQNKLILRCYRLAISFFHHPLLHTYTATL